MYINGYEWIEWWKSEGVYQLVEGTSRTREYHDLLLCTDSIEEVIRHCVSHAQSRSLPLFKSVLFLFDFFFVGTSNHFE